MEVFIRSLGVVNTIMRHVEFHMEVCMCGEPFLDVICAVEADMIPFNNTGSVVWGCTGVSMGAGGKCHTLH